MSPKQLALRWFDEVWNRRNAAAIHEMMLPHSVGYTEAGTVTGPEQFEAQMYRPLLAAFPDLQVVAENCIEEGDEAVLRWSVFATHAGPLLGLAPTGRRVAFSGMSWLRFADGKLLEGWDRWNVHGLVNMLATGTPSATARFLEVA